jgi:hypothetical protein
MRKKNGWGLGMMLVLMGILVLFGFIAIYYMSILYRGF